MIQIFAPSLVRWATVALMNSVAFNRHKEKIWQVVVTEKSHGRIWNSTTIHIYSFPCVSSFIALNGSWVVLVILSGAHVTIAPICSITLLANATSPWTLSDPLSWTIIVPPVLFPLIDVKHTRRRQRDNNDDDYISPLFL